MHLGEDDMPVRIMVWKKAWEHLNPVFVLV